MSICPTPAESTDATAQCCNREEDVCQTEVYKGKDCKCYGQDLDTDYKICLPKDSLKCAGAKRFDPMDPEDGCDPGWEVHEANWCDQYCAYEGQDGYLYPCNSKCCNDGKGCPGQCKGADLDPNRKDLAAAPQGIPINVLEQPFIDTGGSSNKPQLKFNKFLQIVIVIIIGFVLINMIILLVSSFSVGKTNSNTNVKGFKVGLNDATLQRLFPNRKNF